MLACSRISFPLPDKIQEVLQPNQSAIDDDKTGQELEDIKADLLVGRVSEGRMNQLMALISQARERSDRTGSPRSS